MMTAPTTAAPRTMVSAYDADEAVLHPAQPARQAAMIAVPVPFTVAVDAVVVEPQQAVGEPLAGPHEAPPR